MSLLSFLFGCKPGNPYHKEDGQWYYDKFIITDVRGTLIPLNKRFAKDDAQGLYRGAAIAGSDAETFEALDEHYAKDGKQVYYCDTYRESKDYFYSKHNRIIVAGHADPASFQLLEGGYGKDRNMAYSEGVPFKVKDVSSFQVLTSGFTKDKLQAYYYEQPVEGSDGASFECVDSHYGKDKARVYYCFLDHADPDRPSTPKSLPIPSADPSSFQVLQDGYSKDTLNLYYNNLRVASNALPLQILGNGYARVKTSVFYNGKPVNNADPESFRIADPLAEDTEKRDAYDKSANFKLGKKVR